MPAARPRADQGLAPTGPSTMPLKTTASVTSEASERKPLQAAPTSKSHVGSCTCESNVSGLRSDQRDEAAAIARRERFEAPG